MTKKGEMCYGCQCHSPMGKKERHDFPMRHETDCMGGESMSQPDAYTKPKGPHVRTNRQDDHKRNYEGKGESDLASILSDMEIEAHIGNYLIPVYGEYVRGKPAFLRPDAFIHDSDFGWGVFEVDGGIHSTDGQKKWDAEKDRMYEKMGLWVERLSPTEAKDRKLVEGRLERHRRKVDEYGGAL